MLLRQGDTALGITLRYQELAAESLENARIIACVCLRMRMANGIGALNCSVHSHNGRIVAAKQPEWPRHQRKVGHAGILAGHTRCQSILLAARLEGFESPFDRFLGSGDLSHEQADHRLPAHRIEQGWPVAARLGEMK